MLRKGIIAAAWFLVVGWMAAVFYLSCLEKPDVPAVGTAMPDYINHGAAYFLLAFLVFIALQRTRPSSMGFTFAFTVGWAVIFGLGMEFAQKYLTDTRTFDMWDVLADGVGAALAFLVLFALRKSGDKGNQLYALLMGSP